MKVHEIYILPTTGAQISEDLSSWVCFTEWIDTGSNRFGADYHYLATLATMNVVFQMSSLTSFCIDDTRSFFSFFRRQLKKSSMFFFLLLFFSERFWSFRGCCKRLVIGTPRSQELKKCVKSRVGGLCLCASLKKSFWWMNSSAFHSLAVFGARLN